MKILASATANRICTCLSLCVDWTVWSLGPILIASAVTLITLCATVFYTIILPYEYGTLASGDSPNTPPAAGRTYPLSYYVQIALSIARTTARYANAASSDSTTTGRCVGHYNHRYFYLFMCYLLLCALYFCAAGRRMFWTAFVDHDVMSIAWPGAGWAVLFLFSFLLAGVISVALGLLVGFHTYLILTEFYENQYQRKAARARGEAFFNEYDLGRRRNVAIFFNIGKRYKWWTMLLPIRVPPLGDGTTWLTGRKLASRDFELDGSEFKDHIMPI
ncbi:hypothetical protein SeMB42_g02794 [Synchytrium endobioticum]|uniref:Palmitoyltransferase n=1 Tax=Synchytrium endobioticum TaxID=286115 RepID=A0A507DBH5_9FUNG|nr:hypothetical protein SeMB42_g02794 [Synchytrium endobioticum]